MKIDGKEYFQDPVHNDPKFGGWYFWDETWANRVGPYDTEAQAREALIAYARTL